MNKKEYILLFKKIFKKLWPLNRSITGLGLRETHRILKQFIPLKTYELKSGKKFHDWIIPNEWNVKDAFIKDGKKKIIDFKKNNLHILGYSAPYEGYLKLNELKKNLHYIKNLPNAVPYVTSYYKKKWGFSLSYNQFRNLKKKEYFIKIDSSFKKNGSMTISDLYLPGKVKKEILIHSYTCHPSLAINELSGPLTAAIIAKQLLKVKHRYFSYRFVFCPETIGAISYLKLKGKILKKNLIGGFVCNSLGYKKYLTYKRSKKNKTLIDIAAENVLKKNKKFKTKLLNFKPSGSDERQYCSLGYNLPMGCFLSKPNYAYPEYHTSLDKINIINFNSIYETNKVFIKIFSEMERLYKNGFSIEKNKSKLKIKKLEKNKEIIPLNNFKNGEPQLSRHNIHYGKNKSYKDADNFTLAVKWLIHYSDGINSLNKISKISSISLRSLKSAFFALKKEKILKTIN